MVTKLEAAQIATTAGVRTVITNGKQPGNILRVLQGEAVGTQVIPQPKPNRGRKRWIAASLPPVGRLYVDEGAAKAILSRGKSLLAAGIIEIAGEFQPQEAVQLCTLEGEEIARGIVNYSDQDLRRIMGRRSDDIPTILGYVGSDTVVHRDNLVVIKP
jgi:glutamate 5-kinase